MTTPCPIKRPAETEDEQWKRFIYWLYYDCPDVDRFFFAAWLHISGKLSDEVDEGAA